MDQYLKEEIYPSELPVDAVAFGRLLVYYIHMSIEGGGEGGLWITK